eukprot:gene1014-566_t
MSSNSSQDSFANQAVRQIRTFTREERHATGKGWCAGGKGGTGFKPKKKSQWITPDEYYQLCGEWPPGPTIPTEHDLAYAEILKYYPVGTIVEVYSRENDSESCDSDSRYEKEVWFHGFRGRIMQDQPYGWDDGFVNIHPQFLRIVDADEQPEQFVDTSMFKCNVWLDNDDSLQIHSLEERKEILVELQKELPIGCIVSTMLQWRGRVVNQHVLFDCSQIVEVVMEYDDCYAYAGKKFDPSELTIVKTHRDTQRQKMIQHQNINIDMFAVGHNKSFETINFRPAHHLPWKTFVASSSNPLAKRYPHMDFTVLGEDSLCAETWQNLRHILLNVRILSDQAETHSRIIENLIRFNKTTVSASTQNMRMSSREEMLSILNRDIVDNNKEAVSLQLQLKLAIIKGFRQLHVASASDEVHEMAVSTRQTGGRGAKGSSRGHRLRSTPKPAFSLVPVDETTKETTDAASVVGIDISTVVNDAPENGVKPNVDVQGAFKVNEKFCSEQASPEKSRAVNPFDVLGSTGGYRTLNGQLIFPAYFAKANVNFSEMCNTVYRPFGRAEFIYERWLIRIFQKVIRCDPGIHLWGFSKALTRFTRGDIPEDAYVSKVVSECQNTPAVITDYGWDTCFLPLLDRMRDRLLNNSLRSMMLSNGHPESQLSDIVDTIFNLGECHAFVCIHHPTYRDKLYKETERFLNDDPNGDPNQILVALRS